MAEKEVLNWTTLEKRRAKLGGKKYPPKKVKPFRYVVVFFPLKQGKKFTVSTTGQAEAIVRKAGGSFPRDVLKTRTALAVANNKLYFYELEFTPHKRLQGETTSKLGKKIGYLKCTDYNKLIELVYGGYGNRPMRFDL